MEIPDKEQNYTWVCRDNGKDGGVVVVGVQGLQQRQREGQSGGSADWKGETRLWYISNFTTSQTPLLRVSSLLLTSLV